MEQEKQTLKKYQVVFVDEYNNWWLVGFFDKLQDAEPQLNEMLKEYVGIDYDGNEYKVQFGDDTQLGHLTEYASTYGSCFDTEISCDCGCIEVRGFIFE